MARFETVTLPSGLVVTIRNIKVRDENMLTAPRAQRDPTLWSRLLESLITDVVEVPAFRYEGMYVDRPIKAKHLYTGDRVVALLYARRLTYGDMLDFEWECDSCGASVVWECDLALLPIKHLSQEAIDGELAGDGIFYRTMPDSGQTVGFRLSTGEDEIKVSTIKRKHPSAFLSEMLIARTVSIDGEKRASVKRELVEEWSGLDADWLREEMEAVDCGVDIEIEVCCNECGRTKKVQLPFAGPMFKKSKRLKRSIGLKSGETQTEPPETPLETTPKTSGQASV